MTDQIPSKVIKLLQEYVKPEISIEKAQSLGGGCINHAKKISTSQGEFFLKWNNDCPEDLFLREAECLEELGKAKTRLKIPKVYAKTNLTETDPAILITEFLPPASGHPKSQDEALGTGLAQLHQFRHDKFGFHHDNYCGSTLQDNTWNEDWVDFFGQQRIWHLVELIKSQRGLSGQEIGVYESLIDKLDNWISHKPEPALIHGDLWSGNYMYTSSGPAIIDPASCYADREFELSIMNMFGGFSDRVWQAYQEAYSLPPEWKERNDLYMLYHYLNHYYLFGGHYGTQALGIARRFAG
ncbi:MAG: fructosamine kinase family protein [Candidatus Cyclobacteriaceae bacterium M3_2C_046]